MSSIKWIKLNVDMFDDEKIKIIQSMPEGDSLLIVWIKLLTLAGKTNDGGYIYITDSMPYTEEMLATIMNKPIQIIKLAIDVFNQLQMIEIDNKGIFLINFEKYQSLDRMQEIREYNKLAQRKHREKIKCQNLSMTSQCCQDIDIDKEEDIDIKKKNIKKEKFTKPTINEIQEYCTERNNSVNAESFFNFYESKDWYVGKNKMKDWKAAIRTWEQRTNKTTNKEEEIIKRFLNEEE